MPEAVFRFTPKDTVVDPWERAKDVPLAGLVNGAQVGLEVRGRCVLDNAERYAHCEAAMRAGYPVLVGPGTRIFEAPTVLVGTGPSALRLLPEIRERHERGEEIIAVKGAHDWLIRNGIVPRAAIALDPQQSRAKCFRKPRHEVLYLCASQMHPDAWDHLRGHQVLIWHSRIDADQHQREEWRRRYIVPCASTTGNSAILLLHLLGRRKFVLYGYDSSIPEPEGWAQRTAAKMRGRLLKLDGSRADRGKQIVRVTVGGRSYQTTAELVQQAQEVYPLLKSLRNVTIETRGDGLYQAIVAQGKAQGWPV